MYRLKQGIFLFTMVLIGIGVVFSLYYILKVVTYVGQDATETDIVLASALADRNAPFEEYADFFENVAKEKGGAYAFDIMRTVPLAFGLDTHLLGHTVGDILYEQEGIAGMGLCSHDFRNACSHTMVIGALIEFGTGAFSDIQQACYDAPGGKGAYTMCFHGLGHGVLAFNGYDMPSTLQMCEMLGTDSYGYRESVECFGGAIMEIIGGGGHDKEAWDVMRDEYLKPENPFGMCEEAYVTEKYKAMCYNYMTPYAYESFGANMARPSPEIYKKTFALCAQIPEEEVQVRASCYGGLGKEFIGIAVGRNFAAGSAPTRDQLQLMQDWCMLADEADGRMSCSRSVADSLYWGGEQPFEIAVAYCSLIDSDADQTACFEHLTRNVSIYIDNVEYHQTYCAAIPELEQHACQTQLEI